MLMLLILLQDNKLSSPEEFPKVGLQDLKVYRLASKVSDIDLLSRALESLQDASQT